jgi:hypothetical protein
MKRLACLLCILCASAANATLSVPKERPLGEILRPRATKIVVDEATELRLDGNPCTFEELPATAEVILLELGADGRTILKLHFRTTPSKEK